MSALFNGQIFRPHSSTGSLYTFAINQMKEHINDGGVR